MPAIVWSADARTFRFTYVSAAAESILGFPARRWIDEPDFWASHLHPEDSDVPSRCHRATLEPRDHELLYRMIAADGRVVWLRDVVKVRVEDGVPTELYGVMIDVTREREAELALVESRESFKRLVELSPDCIGVHVDGTFVYVNEAFVRLVGASSAAEVIGRGAASFAYPTFHDAIRERHAQLRDGLPVPYMRQVYTRLDGALIDVEIAGLPITYEGKPAVRLVAHDITDRVRDEERLRSGETRLQTLASGTNEAIWEWDLDTGEFWTNAAYRELKGADTPGQTFLDDWFSRIHPDDVHLARERALSAVAGEQSSWRLEYRFRSQSGEYLVLLDRGRNVVTGDGRRRLIGAMLDITSLRQAESDRRDADAKFRSIVEQSLVGVYTRQGARLTYVNRAFAAMLGYEIDELLAMEDPTILIREPDRDSFLSSGGVPPLVHATSKNGRPLYLSVFDTPLTADGQHDVHIGTLVDVTAQHEAERELIDSERRYRELVDSVGDILFTVDAEGRFLSLSRSFETISGYSVADWIGEPFVKLFAEESAPQAVDHFRQTLAGDSQTIRQYEISGKNGDVLTIEVTAQARSVDGVVVGTVGVARDVTQIRNAERKLDDARRVASLGQLAASLAHEFNNVLMGIQPFVELIERTAPAVPRVTDSIGHIKRAVARGKRASQEILRFANPQKARVSDIECAPWLASIVSQLRPTVPGNITLRSSVAADVKYAKADREQLDQIITNLVFNARDAMTQGGTIDLSMDRIPVAQSDDRWMVRVQVADDGPGIPEELAPRIFEPLFTTKRNGTGLGLPIAARLIEAIGGSLRLLPSPSGTCFELLVPEGSAPEAALPLPVRPATTARRVLLVEDDEGVGEGLCKVLAAEGFETTWVRDIESALLRRIATQPDVAIIDINLPDGSGLDLLARLRETWQSLRVVLSTGHVERTYAEDPHTISLLKPYEVSDLLDAITTVTA